MIVNFTRVTQCCSSSQKIPTIKIIPLVRCTGTCTPVASGKLWVSSLIAPEY